MKKLWKIIKTFYGISFCISGFIILVVPFVEEDFSIIAGVFSSIILFLLSFLCLKKNKKSNTNEEQDKKVENIGAKEDEKVFGHKEFWIKNNINNVILTGEGIININKSDMAGKIILNI